MLRFLFFIYTFHVCVLLFPQMTNETFNQARALHEKAQKADFPENISIYEKAIAFYEKIPHHRKLEDYHLVLNDLAVYYRKIDINKSINISHKLLELQKDTCFESVDSLLILSNLSAYYNEIGNFVKALECNEFVLDKRQNETLPNYDKIRISYLRMAGIYRNLHDYNNAILYSEKARNLAFDLYGKDSEEYARSLQNTSIYLWDSGDTIKALEYMKEVYLNSKGNKLDNLYNLAVIYGNLQIMDSCHYYVEKAWELSKKAYAKELSLMSEENRFHFVCTNRVSMGMSMPIFLSLQRETHTLNRLAFDCILFNKNIIQDCMKGEDEINKSLTIGLDSIRSYLHNNEVAIEFWTDKSEPQDTGIIVSLIIKKEWEYPRMVLLSKAKIHRTLSGNDETYESYLPLYENIWKEIIEIAELKGGENVYLSLDDVLAKVPIEAICNYQFEYMGDKYNVIRVSSTKNIPIVRQNSFFKGAVLYGGLKYDSKPHITITESQKHYSNKRSIQENLFNQMGDYIAEGLRSANKYLPWTKVEVDSIYTILSKTNGIKFIRLYEGEKGVEESFKSLSGSSPSIIHIATHGVCIQPTENPNMSWFDYYSYCMEHSGLLFSGALTTDKINTKESLKVEDGILRSTEISLLDLSNTNLVVLSACKTGMGGTTPFGIAGLQRAFKAAGAKTLILSLNDVDDSATYMMMVSFYKALMLGHSKREAFKIAQQCLRKSEEFHSFEYWAYFVMLD